MDKEQTIWALNSMLGCLQKLNLTPDQTVEQYTKDVQYAQKIKDLYIEALKDAITQLKQLELDLKN